MFDMWYDVTMVGIVLYTTIRGSTKGIAWQLAAIGALLLCFAFATPLSLVVAPAIHLDPLLNRWVAMLGIYLVFSFICFGAARMFRNWLESWKFEEYDKHLGAMFGLVKGATICLVLTFFTVCLSAPAREYVLATYSGRASRVVMHRLTAVLPAEIDRVLEPYVDRLDKAEPLVADGAARDDDFRGSSRPVDDLFGSDGDA